MHAVYYKKKTKNIVLWAYLATTVQASTITAYVENDHCSWSAKWQRFLEHVLLSGPKLQNTNRLLARVDFVTFIVQSYSFALRVIIDILWSRCFEIYGPKDTR